MAAIERVQVRRTGLVAEDEPLVDEPVEDALDPDVGCIRDQPRDLATRHRRATARERDQDIAVERRNHGTVGVCDIHRGYYTFRLEGICSALGVAEASAQAFTTRLCTSMSCSARFSSSHSGQR